jgi:hypothetical protein
MALSSLTNIQPIWSGDDDILAVKTKYGQGSSIAGSATGTFIARFCRLQTVLHKIVLRGKKKKKIKKK